MKKNKVELIDYSEINQIIGEYANLPFKIFVNGKFSALVQNKKGEYALISEKYELTHPVIGYDDFDDIDNLEMEYEVLFDLDGDNSKKYKYTILLDSILESNKTELDFDSFFDKNSKNENIENFTQWYN
jgi:hypothetical protein